MAPSVFDKYRIVLLASEGCLNRDQVDLLLLNPASAAGIYPTLGQRLEVIGTASGLDDEGPSVVRCRNGGNVFYGCCEEGSAEYCWLYGNPNSRPRSEYHGTVQNRGRRMLTRGVTLLHDNVRPHSVPVSQELLTSFGWDIVTHPPYSHDLAPSDYHFFTKLKEFLGGKRFYNNQEVKEVAERAGGGEGNGQEREGMAKSPKVRKESTKREREESRTSEEGTDPFRESSRTGRSPSRSEEGNKSKEMKTMIREIREDTAGIREENKVLRKELATVSEEKEELRKELAAVREEMRGREEKWQAEEADWMKRMKMVEEKMEQREKKERKNNVIITGIGGERGNIERGGGGRMVRKGNRGETKRKESI
ncbi:hypothetical protein GEV33_013767 [Tenebrio molitor]|uniref:Histone-lysine N-methyltransferase SETMAR n=1 Tax=Tenebrio molitor TaxID=7067 RepID=A0A8J6H681_TENMO|nr:hypothetical protein GEV33_013767 [Tenebrio molitor]